MKYYSETLNQLFSSEEELREAEKKSAAELEQRNAQRQEIENQRRALEMEVKERSIAKQKAFSEYTKADIEHRAAGKKLQEFDSKHRPLRDFDSIFDALFDSLLK